MPPRGRKPRTAPLAPVPSEPGEPSASEVPICGACFPGGWPAGGDFASCEHGDWSTGGQPVAWPVPVRVRDEPIAALVAGRVLDGVTTDGISVSIELRPGQPALVSLGNPRVVPEVDPVAASFAPSAVLAAAQGKSSPFSPKPAPAVVDAEELDTGEDVMFMPDGG